MSLPSDATTENPLLQKLLFKPTLVHMTSSLVDEHEMFRMSLSLKYLNDPYGQFAMPLNEFHLVLATVLPCFQNKTICVVVVTDVFE